jgi:hypothetical protein
MLERAIGALKADVNVFEEIEHDEGATSQAVIIVAIVALLSAISRGLAIVGETSDEFFLGAILFFSFTLIWTFISWLLWSGITYFVGTNLFGAEATMGEMLRVIGFAYVPQVLSIIPFVGLLAWLWSSYVGFVAVRQGLDLDNIKTFFTVAIGVIINIVLFIVIAMYHEVIIGLIVGVIFAVFGGGP